WVRSVEDSDDLDPSSQALLPRTPCSVRPASHNSFPSPRPNAAPGRRFDYARERLPPLPSSPLSDNASRWRNFAVASQYHPPSTGHSEIVSREWMMNNMGDLDAPWEPAEPDQSELEKQISKKKRGWLSKLHKTVMRSPYVPLIIRMNVLVFSAAALGLAGRIFHLTHRNYCSAGSSTYLAIIVDAIAIVYLCYVTYDEYAAQPLGLRDPTEKLRLIFLDLAFIVFDSANLSIAFQSLTDSNWACVNTQSADLTQQERTCYDPAVCGKQKALTAVILVSLVTWLFTFAVSTLR
ncbi:uncharacterized protein K452DRAFT_193356, partial [Aplosporella prunicola CBS 121167]